VDESIVAEVREIGTRIREIRKSRKLSLAQLGKEVGVSGSFLSQLERGVCNASFGTLRSITQALGVSLPDLMGEAPPARERVLRKSSRPLLLDGAARKYLMSLPPLDSIEIFLGEFEPGSSSGEHPYSHGDSQEFFFVVRGSVVLELDGVEYNLNEGDMAEYRSSQMHRTANKSQELAEVLWIVSPVTVSSKEIEPISKTR